MTISDQHIDASHHVNNSCYLSFFEQARWEIFKDSPFRKDKIHSLGIAPVLIECNLRYKRELVLGETITIKTYVQSIHKDLVVNMKQTIYNQENKKSCLCQVRHGLLDLQTRKMIPLDQDWLKHLKKS